MENGFCHLNGTEILFHVMNTDKSGSLHHTENCRHQGTFHTLGGRKIQCQSYNGFSGGSK